MKLYKAGWWGGGGACWEQTVSGYRLQVAWTVRGSGGTVAEGQAAGLAPRGQRGRQVTPIYLQAQMEGTET